MPRHGLAEAALLSLLFAGCECGAAPAGGCTTSLDCASGQVCVDGRCAAGRDTSVGDARPDTEARDTATRDSGALDAAADTGDGSCVSLACGTEERCFDGLDNDCDDTVDETCGCAPGSTARCLPAGTDPTLGICGWGEMPCVGSGEFGTWGACTGVGSSDGGAASPYGCRRIGIMGAQGANPSSNFQAWLQTQGAIATRFHASASAPALTRAELETFDLVVVDWLQRLYTAAEADVLTGWVTEGGALMVMTGHDSGATADRHLSLLASLGPTYDRAAGAIDGPATLLAHPTTLESDGVNTLPPVTFYGGLRTIVPPALAADIVPMAAIGSEIVGVAGPLGAGRVLLFGDEWIEFDSEWSTMPPIIQLWLNTVRWLSPDPGIPVCR